MEHRRADSRGPLEGELFRLVAENVHDFALFALDLDGKVSAWNPGAERLFGWPEAEILGRDGAVLFTPEDRAAGVPAREMAQARQHGRADAERWHLRKDGSRFFGSGVMSPIRDGELRGYAKVARDVTERRRGEERLRRSEERYRALVEAISQAVWLWSPAGGEADFSHAGRWWEELTGQPDHADATSWLAVVHPDDHDRAALAWSTCRTTTAPYDVEYRVRARQGGWRTVRARGVPIAGPDGSVREWVGTLDDVTAQRQAEAAVRENAERLALTLAAASLGAWSWDPASDEVTLSPRAAEIFGVPPGGRLTRTQMRALMHPEDCDRTILAVERAIAEHSQYETEYRINRPGGRPVWISARGRAEYDATGRVLGTFGVVQDVTARKRAEERARFLADAGAALAEVTDYEHTLQRIAGLAVPRFADWCTVDMLQADGSFRRLAVQHVDPAKLNLAREVYRKYPPRMDDPRSVALVLRTGKPDWAEEIPDEALAGAAYDDEHLHILRELGLRSYVCVPLVSRRGLLGALTFVTAESGRVYDADDLRAAEDLAGRAVIAIENALMVAALEEADRRKDRFLASSLHLLQMRGGDWSVIEQVRGMMQRQVQHLGRLVDDLLDVSRITLGKVQLKQERLDLGRLIGHAADAHRPAFEARRVSLDVEVPDGPVWVFGDATRLCQILDNLLTNALKYSGDGSLVRVTLTAASDEVLLRVRDGGVGLEPEMLSRLFDAFAQADRTLDRSQGGLGLGLAIVKGLARLHGGEVWAESDGLGRGATFSVSLPRAGESLLPVTAHSAPPTGSASPVPARQLRILVVEDNQDVADSLGLLLRAFGYEVAVAYSGPEGVRAAGAYRPDVVICDVGLPGLDGYGVAAALRGDPQTASARLIALTGYGQDEDRRRAREAGFDEHLTKPADPVVLRELLTGGGG